MRSGPRGSWFGLSEYPRDTALERMRALMMTTVLRPGPRARVLGFKEIRWPVKGTEHLVSFLSELFPGARFLFNTRNPEDVAKSEWWADAKNPVEQIATGERVGGHPRGPRRPGLLRPLRRLCQRRRVAAPAVGVARRALRPEQLQRVLDTRHGY